MPHVDKGKKKAEPVSDSESESMDMVSANGVIDKEKSQASVMKEIKQTFAAKGPKDFTKIRILGKGGVGRVYLVRLNGTDKLFAMKVLKQEEMISRNKVKRVLTEREVLATTKHPFIISLYYSFQSRSRLYFVMDYCAGGEFYRTIQMQPHKCLTEDQMRFYAAEVLLALEYLHVMGFVYRDLKPENILLHASGHIRLTDFDLSKASVTPVNAHVVQSMMGNNPTLVAEPSLVTNSFVGTEEYLAPEVIVGKGYGASVDWWTFGILMYEMLYGFTPFRGKSQPDTFHKIEKSHVKFPEHQRCTVSKECKNLIKKLLSHDPKKRLGYEQGASEIKAHPFFAKITWPLIRNQTPPIIPDLGGPLDFRYFSSRIVDDDKDDEDVESVNPDLLDANHPFKAFAPVDREMEGVRPRKDKASGRSGTASPSSSNAKPAEKTEKRSSGKASKQASTSHAKGSSRRTSVESTSSSSYTSSSGASTSDSRSSMESSSMSDESDHEPPKKRSSTKHRKTSKSHRHHDADDSSDSAGVPSKPAPKKMSKENSSSGVKSPKRFSKTSKPVNVSDPSSSTYSSESDYTSSSFSTPDSSDHETRHTKTTKKPATHHRSSSKQGSTKVPKSRTPLPDEELLSSSPKTKTKSPTRSDDQDHKDISAKLKKASIAPSDDGHGHSSKKSSRSASTTLSSSTAALSSEEPPTKLKKSGESKKDHEDHVKSSSRHSSSKRAQSPPPDDDDPRSERSDKYDSHHHHHSSSKPKVKHSASKTKLTHMTDSTESSESDPERTPSKPRSKTKVTTADRS